MAEDNDNWSSESWKEPKAITPAEAIIVKEAKKRYHICEDWEAQARILFDYDYKFANGDTHNKYQWDADLVVNRELEDRPCLTINKTWVHNLLVINDAKQNKPGVRIRPVGDKASYEGAQIFQELVYHIEYISNAENVYDNATVFQVEAGMGYWRVMTDYISDDSFDQEIYIRRIKDPRSVYLDPNINEADGSDASFGFIFEDMAKDLFAAKYPDFASIAGSTTLGNASQDGGWITRENIRVAEYYRKTQKKDKLVAFIDPQSGQQVIKKYSELSDEGKQLANQLKKLKEQASEYEYQERKVVSDDIQWFKIAGDRIIDQGPWLGKYIPIVRLPGTETVIDGVLDRKGHTRALINAQQMYNYNTSANVEFGALQTKSPWVAATEAIEGFEEYYKTANTSNRAYLPYNAIGEDGKPLPAPVRPQGPQPGTAYVQGMQISQNEMMMATGQYQSQMGENENAKSGVAINARQRQGDKATYHFIDNQAIAIRFTGKIIIDLIPKIYDTKRIMQIEASDGSILDVTVDPKAEKGFEDVSDPNNPKMLKSRKIKEIVFNPNFGLYDIQADTGPSYATKRMEATAALTQVAAADKDFLKTAGDIYFEMMDFPKADVLAERYRNLIPKNVIGEGPDPETEQMMHGAADKIEELTKIATDQANQLANRDKEYEIKDKEATIRAQELDLALRVAKATQARLDYEAETKRLVALGNSGPGVSIKQIQPVAKQLLSGMLFAGEPGDIDELSEAPGPHEGGTISELPQGSEGQEEAEEPPMEGAKKAGDGNWYLQHPEGNYSRVEMNG